MFGLFEEVFIVVASEESLKVEAQTFPFGE